MQFYKPFRLHGPPRRVASNALFLPLPFRSCDLSTSPLLLASLARTSRPPSPVSIARGRFNAVLQFQPHFCASLSPRANSDNTSRPYQAPLLIAESASAFIFSGHSAHFRKNPRSLPRLCKRSRAKVQELSQCAFRVSSRVLISSLRVRAARNANLMVSSFRRHIIAYCPRIHCSGPALNRWPISKFSLEILPFLCQICVLTSLCNISMNVVERFPKVDLIQWRIRI